MAVKQHGACLGVCTLEGKGTPEFKSAQEQSAYIEVTGDRGTCHTNADDKLSE